MVHTSKSQLEAEAEKTSAEAAAEIFLCYRYTIRIASSTRIPRGMGCFLLKQFLQCSMVND